MRILVIIILVKFCACSLQAQNLIPNPSFEDTVHLNFDFKEANDWFHPTNSESEYYTVFHNQKRPDWGVLQNLIGYQNAKSGRAYIGLRMYPLDNNIVAQKRDYIQAKLINSLKSDSVYCFQIYVSLSDSSQYASKNQLGVFFSQNQISENTDFHLPYTPQIIVSPDDYIVDKVKWLRFDFEYTASGGEEYITIGNFNDTTGIDTLFVGGGEQFWQKTTYYYIDDLYLGHCDSLPDTTIGIIENELKQKLQLYPNPVGRQFYLTYSGQEQLHFQLYNLMGQKVEAAVQEEGNRYRFSSGHLPKGVYLLRVVGREGRASFRLVKE